MFSLKRPREDITYEPEPPTKIRRLNGTQSNNEISEIHDQSADDCLSFMSLDKTSVRTTNVHKNNARKRYECNILFIGEKIEFEANWYCGDWSVFGFIEFFGLLKHGQSPYDVNDKERMVYFDVYKMKQFRKRIEPKINILKMKLLSDFEWIKDILECSMWAVVNNEKYEWMSEIFEPPTYIDDTLRFFGRECLKEKRCYNNVIEYWIRKNNISKNIGTVSKQLIKCYACTKHGCCCGVLNKHDQTLCCLDFI
eukprot:132363_1